MKITALRVSVLGVPLDPPVQAARFQIPTLDPTRPEAAATALGAVAFKAGPGGMGTWAAGAIEVAIWDLFGKITEQPLYRLLGGANDRLPAYCLRGLTNRTEGELFDELTQVAADGWRNVKIQIPGVMGDGHPDTVASNLHRVREHVGEGIRLALDNQSIWSAPQAIRLGRQVEDLDLFWFEEPVDYRDTAGIGHVAAALDTPVCSGEQRYGVFEFRSLIESKAVDVVMVDVRMAGGVTAFRKIAAVCEMWNLPVTSHMMTAIDMHVMAALPNAAVLEYVPWTDAIFEEPIEVRGGDVILPERPGLGCTLQKDAKDRFAI